MNCGGFSPGFNFFIGMFDAGRPSGLLVVGAADAVVGGFFEVAGDEPAPVGFAGEPAVGEVAGDVADEPAAPADEAVGGAAEPADPADSPVPGAVTDGCAPEVEPPKVVEAVTVTTSPSAESLLEQPAAINPIAVTIAGISLLARIRAPCCLWVIVRRDLSLVVAPASVPQPGRGPELSAPVVRGSSRSPAWLRGVTGQ